MLSRHLSLPHKITVITDAPVPKGMDAFPVSKTITKGHDGNCMRRLWLYSAKAAELGDRLLQLDLDVVITDSIDQLIDRSDPFVIWRGDSNIRLPRRTHNWAYNPTVMLLDAGARMHVWDEWRANPDRIYAEATAHGWDPKVNSDQGIATYLMDRDQSNPPAVWTEKDGIHAFRIIAGKNGDRGRTLPKGCRIVSFHGKGAARQPDSEMLRDKCPWIVEHWR